MQLSVLIYNKADFDNLFIKVNSQVMVFSSLGSAPLTSMYTAPFLLTKLTDVMFGFQGMDFAGQADLGF